MRNWPTTHRLPLLTVCFILGLLAADNYPLPHYFFLFLLVGCFALAFFTKRFLLAALVFVLLGWGHGTVLFSRGAHFATREIKATPQSYRLRVTGPVHFTPRGATVSARLLQEGEGIPTELVIYEGVPAVRRGEEVAVWGRVVPVAGLRNPGAPDPVRQSHREGIAWVTKVASAQGVVPIGDGAGRSLFRLLEGWRSRLRRELTRFRESDGIALLRGLLLGDRSGLSEGVQEDFRRSGLAHLLAISGQHVGLVALLCFACFRTLLSLVPTVGLYIPLPHLAWLLAWLPTSLYVGIAGFPVSAIRAWILFSLMVIAVVLRRGRALLSALALAALIILWVSPAALFEISFQLSFLAAATLILIFQKQAMRTRHRLGSLVISSLAVTVALAPLVAYYFSRVSWIGVLANLVAIPYLGFVLLPVALLSLLVWPLWESGAGWLLHGAELLADGLLWLSHQLAFSGGEFHFGLRPLQAGLCYLAFGLGYVIPGRGWRKLTVAALALVILLGGESLYTDQRQKGLLTLTLLDVGQGDAMVLRLPDRSTYLVDGGGFYIPKEQRDFAVSDPGERVLIPYLKRQGVRRLAGIVLTHPHPDHYGGLVAVARAFPVARFYWNGDRIASEEFDALLTALQDQETTFVTVAGQAAPTERAGVRLEWLNPPLGANLSYNDRSIVMKASYGNHCFLLAGDIEAAAERRLQAEHDLSCPVLKVPHHLSRTSSSETFLASVRPRYALASLGRNNPFGFPHREALSRYRQKGIPLVRTDQNGAITVESDGKDLRVKTVVMNSSPDFPRK